MSLILSAFSALFYGIADFAGGFASARSKTLSVLVVSQAAGLFVAFCALLVFWPGLPGGRDLLWGMSGGICGALGLFMLYRGIATSLVAVVSPASALLSAILPLGFGLLLGESPSPLARIGALLCLPAVLLLSWQRKTEGGKSVLSALLQGSAAGLGFGGFYIFISRASPGSGLWPAIASRGTSLCIFLLALAILARRERKAHKESAVRGAFPKGTVLGIAPSNLAVTCGAGIADMTANVLFLLASRTGLLSLVSIVTSLYPAPTVILGRIVFKEAIPPSRAIGLLLAITGIVLISLK